MKFQFTLEKSTYLLSTILVIVMLSVIAITILELYDTALEQQRERLSVTVQSQTRLVEAVARFDSQYSQTEISGGAEQATLLQIREAYSQYRGFGKTGEFTLAKLEDNHIHFLLQHRVPSLNPDYPSQNELEMGSKYAIPMQLALSGKSGTVIDLDYHGAIVLAAYEPVSVLNYGMVAKIDLDEVQAPFWRAGLFSFAVGSLFILIGVIGFQQVTRPMIKAIHESKERYKGLFENSEVSIWDEDFSEVKKALDKLYLEGISDLRQYLEENPQVAWDLLDMVRVNQVNSATLKLFKASSEDELMGSIEKVFGPTAIDVFKNQLCAFWAREKIFRSDAIQKTLDGELLEVIISMPIPETDEGYHNLPVSILDITKRKQMEEELKKISRAVESSSTMVIITDHDGIIEYVNPKFTEITLYSREEAIGQSPSILNSGEQSKELYEEMWKTILSGREWKQDIRNCKKDGTLYWDRVSISGVKDANGNLPYFVSIQDDVSEVYKLTEQLSYQASYDALTGLINRREFEQRANRLLSTIQQDKAEHAMCFLDLDQFKVINDSCGHAAGDELLHQLGKVLQKTVRKQDTLARLGGDEFGLLMEHCPLGQAHRVAEALLQAITGYQFFWEGGAYRIGVSIGLVAITETTGNFTELFKQADAACYLAKDLGRNRIHTYHPDDTILAIRHGEMQWVGRIYQALDDDRFCLYAQPIIALDTGKRQHYELLLRMLDEQGEIIPPGAFLPAAERYNLIEKVDAWVLNHACTFLAENPRFVESIEFVSINISGPSLTNKDFLETIINKFAETGISPEKFCFEITETVAVSNLELAAKFISTLMKAGCHFALDDFGSGISSFGYLKNLPVDYLKIDGMFVKDIVNDPIDYAMVKSINEIGQVMGMKTIAEFVENDEIRRMLEAIGVNYAQGFGLGKPEPLEELGD